jgi:hypothetical protein
MSPSGGAATGATAHQPGHSELRANSCDLSDVTAAALAEVILQPVDALCQCLVLKHRQTRDVIDGVRSTNAQKSCDKRNMDRITG